jgi:hypothetical protein
MIVDMTVTWSQVHAWRMDRQFLTTPARGIVDIVGRLCGVQAQVASSAELAIAVRLAKPAAGGADRAIADARVIKTWAMRGTLHLLAPTDAPAYLSLLSATRTWEKSSWQKTFKVDSKQMAAMAEACPSVLADRVLTREEFVTALTDATGLPGLGEELRSGWGMVLKPLAWMGLLCNGPSRGNRVTFTSPETWVKGWTGVPPPEEAAATAVPAYLGAYGPASPETFDRWLCRGVSKKAALRSWFADRGDALTTVDVEGEKLFIRAEDADALARTKPSETVRLLPAFDQWVLGPGTQDPHVIPPARRALISKTAGWISPVVVLGGRVVGTWETSDDTLDVSLFGEAGKVDARQLAAEADRVAHVLEQPLSLRTATI